MRVLLGVVMVVGLCEGKKAKEPPRTHETTAKLSVSCAKAWPVVLKAYMERGFGIKAGTSKESGVAEFEWRQGAELPVVGHVNATVKAWTTAPANFFSMYTGFRIDGATVLMIDGESGCELSAKHAYAGFNRGWLVLPSNGRMESELLEVVRGK